jgi:N-acyl-D-amino-acid deacylase
MILFTNGTLVDGTGAPARRAGLLIEDEKIRDIGPRPATPGMEVVDCAGLVIAPGFVDVHSHSDLEALQHRGEKTRQGIVSQVVGNCGFSLFPTLPRAGLVPSFDLFQGRGEQEWPDAGAYFADLEARGSYTNIAVLAGHAALRAKVAGMKAGRLAATAQRTAEELLARALEQGAVGLSTGLNEVPSSYGDLEELTALCRVVRQYGGLYVSHLRDYKFRILEAVREALEIGRRTGVPVQLSHLQTVGRKNWDKMDAVLALVDQAIAEGVDVGIDAYPYLAGSCHLTQLLPTWALEGGAGHLLARLANPDARTRIAEETEGNMANRWEDILIASAPGRETLDGRTVQAVADERGLSGVQAALDLLLESRGLARIISFNQSEENLRKVLTHPRTVVITDGLVTQGRPHPRTFGTYPKFLGEYVRDKRWMSLEEGVRKATSLPAGRFGLADRGILAPGRWADLAVFAADRIGTRATYQEPDRPPEGIRHVLVNGRWVLREGQLQAQWPGRPLRRGRG